MPDPKENTPPDLEEEKIQSGSRWDWVTIDELLYGRRRNNRGSCSFAGDKTFSELVNMISDYQVADVDRAAAFSKQAEFMKFYEADAPQEDLDSSRAYRSHQHLFIGYQEMDMQELHDYFVWRTAVRNNKKTPYIKGFSVLYAAETISLYAEKDQAGTFDKLLKIQALVHRQREALKKEGIHTSRDEEKKMASIIRDYVIWWGPDPELVQAYCVNDLRTEEENITFCFLEKSDDLTLCRVLRHYIENRIQLSKFLQDPEWKEDAWRVVVRVFRRVCAKQKSAGQRSLAERMLGKMTTRRTGLYNWLPCEAKREEGYQIEVTPVTSYSLNKGAWYIHYYHSMRDDAAVREINVLVRECERVMRKKLHYRNQLPNKVKDPELERLIAQELDLWLKEKERRSRPEIHVDLSKLDAIRDQADVTRDRLLEGTQEEGEIVLGKAINAVWSDTAGILSGNMADEDIGKISGVDSGAGLGEASGILADSDSNFVSGEALGKGDGIASGLESDLGKGSDIVPDGTAYTAADRPGDLNVRAAEAQKTEGSAAEAGADLGTSAKNLGTGTGGEGIFDKKQAAFLKLLLDGGNGADYLRSLKGMPSVFVDAINEKAFDEIGDSIVEEDGKAWKLVEDYIDDVKDLLGI